MTAPRLVQPPVVADHHSPLRCCPLCEVNRLIGLHDSNGVAHACDSGTTSTTTHAIGHHYHYYNNNNTHFIKLFFVSSS